MMTQLQKDLHEEYRKNLELAWDGYQSMVDYCVKKAEIVVKTEDGDLLEIERQNIKTHFCFGYGYCGISDEEDEERASNMAHHARTQAQYFIDENLEWYDNWIKQIEKYGAYVSKNGHYTRQPKECKLQHFTSGKGCWNRYPEDDPNMKKLSETDTQKLIQGFKDAREHMVKRLNTYLKKYGLEKLDVWTYLVD